MAESRSTRIKHYDRLLGVKINEQIRDWLRDNEHVTGLAPSIYVRSLIMERMVADIGRERLVPFSQQHQTDKQAHALQNSNSLEKDN